MFGKAKQQEGAGNAEKGSERGLTTLKLFLPAILLVVLVVLISGYLAYLQYAGLVKSAQQVQNVATAERMAALLGGRLVALGEQVASQAKADNALSAAISQGDTYALREFERRMFARFPDAIRVRVIRPEDTEPDASVTPPIGYACLDLARQAEAGIDRPPLEIHLHGQDEAHLDLVRPIMRKGDVIASLMVSFAPERITDWLNELTMDDGYVELQQGWEGPLLGQTGNGDLRTAEAAHRAVIPGSSWQLSYWADDGFNMAMAQKIGFFMTFVVSAAVIAGLLFFYVMFISSTIKGELRRMAEFMVESSRGKRFHSYPVKMVEMEMALDMMEPVLSQAKPSDGIKEKAEEGDGGVSDMMFMDFGEITVEESEGEPPSEGDSNKS